MVSEEQSIEYGPTLVLSWPPRDTDRALLNWMADEGMLDWITVEVDHG